MKPAPRYPAAFVPDNLVMFPIPAAYLGVVLIWSTTPLAIKWSSEGAGFLFGVSSRMVLGLAVSLVLIGLLARRLPWHRTALLTYVVGGLGIWGAMTGVYWGAQHIPSGVVSVLFGLSPVVTGLLASLWLAERAFTFGRVTGMLLGLAGLTIIFGQTASLHALAGWGMAAVLAAVFVHSASAVWVKRLDAPLHPLETVTGSLSLAVPLFVLHWGLVDGVIPDALPARAAWSIVYLGVVGSVLGFVLYFHVLRHVQASRVALITLMTPVIALLLGRWVNDEPIGPLTWTGAAVVLAGLAAFQWGDALRHHGSRVPTRP